MERTWTAELERELERHVEELDARRERDEIVAELNAAGLMWQDPVVVEVRRHGGPRLIAA